MAGNSERSGKTLLRSIEQLATVVRGGCDVVWSLVLFNGWVFAMSWSGVFRAPFSEDVSSLVLHGLWLTSLLVCTATLLVFLGLPARWRTLRRAGVHLGTGCMAASAVLAALSHGFAPWGVALFVASALASGVGTGIMSAYWGRVITRYDVGTVMQFVAVGLAGAALVTLAVALVPPVVAYGLMVVLPLLLAHFFVRAVGPEGFEGAAVGCVAKPADRAEIADKEKTGGGEAGEKATVKPPLSKHLTLFLALAVVLGVSAGLLRELTGADVTLVQRAVVFGAATLGAAIMLLSSRVPSEGESFALFYRAIAFIAGAFIILTVVVQQAAYQSALALGLHTMGFMYFYGLMWVFCVLYAQQAADPMRVFVAGFFANQAGQIIGAWAGGGVQAFLGSASFIATASNAMIYVLLFAVIVLMAKLSAPVTAGLRESVKPPTSLASEAGMALGCARAAEHFGLTPREAEILPYLVRGYDRGYIAEMLVVSPETVKSHTRHIYEKAGVHTRVELFNAVAACLGE